MIGNATTADVAKLVDAPDLGSGIARCEGSSPFIRIFRKKIISDLSLDSKDGAIAAKTLIVSNGYTTRVPE